MTDLDRLILQRETIAAARAMLAALERVQGDLANGGEVADAATRMVGEAIAQAKDAGLGL